MKKILFIVTMLPNTLIAMEATVFRVGQGNSVLVSCPDKRILLADAGSIAKPLDAETQKVVDYPKIVAQIIEAIVDKATKKKLCILVSHPDLDHSKWVLQIAQALLRKKFDVRLLLGGSAKTYDTSFVRTLEGFEEAYSKLCHYLFIADVKNKKDFVEHSDLVRQMGKNFLPSYCTLVHAQKTADKTNELCIIARAEHEGFSILLPADAPKKVTDELLKTKPTALRANVLIAFHHGSAADNNKELVEAVQPQCIVISAGMHGRHHHPHLATIILYKDYLEEQTLTTDEPHLLTTHHSGALQPYQSNASDIPNFKPVVFDEEGYAHGPTTLPLYNTTNGTVTLNAEFVEHLSPSTRSLSFEQLALQARALAGFRNITALILTQLNLTDDDVQKQLPALPESLMYVDMRKNRLGVAAIMHLLSLFEHRREQLLIKLDDNKRFTEDQLIGALSEQEIDFEEMDARASINRNTQGLCVDTLELGIDPQPGLPKKLSHYHYGNQWEKFSHACKERVFTMTLNSRFVASYSQKNDFVEMWDVTKKGNKARYIIKNPDEHHYIQALHFNSYNRMLALVCKLHTYIWNRDTETCIKLEGTLRFSEARACYSVGYAVHTLANFDSGFCLPLFSPFSRKADFLATLIPTSNCIKIWLLSAPGKPKAVTTCNLAGRTAQEVRSFYFIDSDRTLRIAFTDGSYHEFPLIMDAFVVKN